MNTLLPILLLLYLISIISLAGRGWAALGIKRSYPILIPLFSYLAFASSSILLNEADVKGYFIYIYSPALLFLCLLSVYSDEGRIGAALKVLFAAGLAFSVYVAFIFSVFPSSVNDIPVLSTNRGEIQGDTGGTFGIGDIGTIRYTIPGISSTTYGPLLVPLILAGLYIRRGLKGYGRLFTTAAVLFLIFCVLMTVSRGPLVSLVAGAAYLVRWRWLKARELSVAAIGLLIAFFTFARLSFLRLFITFLAFMPFDVTFAGDGMLDLIKDPRLQSVSETAAYIAGHPFWGMGMTNLIAAQESSFGKEHNNYLSIGASFGLPALFFYILFIAMLIMKMHERIKEGPSGADMGVVLCAGAISLAVYLNFAPAEFQFIWIWFALAASWVLNQPDVRSGKKEGGEA